MTPMLTAVDAVAGSGWPLRLSVSARIRVTCEDFLPWFLPHDPVGLFNARGPIPGVAEAHWRHAHWSHPGAQRQLVMTDGTRVTEQVVEYQPPTRFRYRMTGLSGLMSRLVWAIDGQWDCAQEAHGSRVCWSYTFVDRGAAALLVLWAMSPLWRSYMRAGLRAVSAAAERELRASPAA